MNILLEHFSHLLDAPDGIAKTRKLILELAIRGKLVPQDPNDESAINILDNIENEKSKLLESKKIRKAKLAPENEWPNVQFALPENWELTALDNLIVNSSDDIVDGPFGSRLKASEYVDFGVPIIRIQNIERNFFKNQNIKYLSENKAEELSRHNFIAGDIVLNKLGEPTGKACIVPDSLKFGIIVADIVRIRLNESIFCKQYIVNSINSPFVAKQFGELAKGVTRQRVNLSQVRVLLVPLPPLIEQEKIATKVDELFAQLDELEKKQQNRDQVQIALNKSSINEMLTAKEAPAFQKSWSRIKDNFELLYNRPETVADLRKAILQLAVMGKLVPQDPNDEPANVLLEKIAIKKDKLIAEGKIKKQKKFLPIGINEIPFDLKKNWAWSRWGNITNWITYGFTRPVSHVKNGLPIITGKNVIGEKIVFHSADLAPEEEFFQLNSKDKPRKGDILVTKDGSIGRAAIVDTDKEFCINQSVAVLWLKNIPLEKRFLLNVLISPFVQDEFLSRASGVAIKHISVTHFGRMLCPVPPLLAQKRIVTKVDELMKLVDQLEKQLKTERVSASQLYDAVVARMFE